MLYQVENGKTSRLERSAKSSKPSVQPRSSGVLTADFRLTNHYNALPKRCSLLDAGS
jgi:hypothetical protein